MPKLPQPTGKPRQPQWLGSDAKDLWHKNAAELEDLGLLTRLDGAAFAALCTWYATFRHYAELHEGTQSDSDSKVVFARMRDASTQLLRWCSEFGLTPVARTRLAIKGHVEDDDEFAEFVSNA